MFFYIVCCFKISFVVNMFVNCCLVTFGDLGKGERRCKCTVK